MKGLILLLSALAVLAVTQTAVVKAQAAGVSVTWGVIAVGDRLLASRNFYQPPIANAVQEQVFTYGGNATTRITAVQAIEDVTQYGTPSIIAGGVGNNTVTVKLTSARGNGYDYQIRIWGR